MCEIDKFGREYGHKLMSDRRVIICKTSGISVPSMPTINLRNDGEVIYTVDASEYFLFKPDKKTTTQAAAEIGFLYPQVDF